MKKTTAPEAAPSIEQIRQRIVAAEQQAKAAGEQRGVILRELNESEALLLKKQAMLRVQEDPAMADQMAETRQQAASFSRIYRMTASELEELREEIAFLEQRIAELKPKAPGAITEKEAAEAALASIRDEVEPVLAQQAHAARARLLELEQEDLRLQERMPAETDADQLIEMRRRADELPLRRVVQEIASIQAELLLLKVSARDYADVGLGAVRKIQLENRWAELEQAKLSLVTGRPMRLATAPTSLTLAGNG